MATTTKAALTVEELGVVLGLNDQTADMELIERAVNDAFKEHENAEEKIAVVMEWAKAESQEESIQLMNDMFQRAFEDLCDKYENSQENASLDIYMQLKTNCEELQRASQEAKLAYELAEQAFEQKTLKSEKTVAGLEEILNGEKLEDAKSAVLKNLEQEAAKVDAKREEYTKTANALTAAYSIYAVACNQRDAEKFIEDTRSLKDKIIDGLRGVKDKMLEIGSSILNKVLNRDSVVQKIAEQMEELKYRHEKPGTVFAFKSEIGKLEKEAFRAFEKYQETQESTEKVEKPIMKKAEELAKVAVKFKGLPTNYDGTLQSAIETIEATRSVVIKANGYLDGRNLTDEEKAQLTTKEVSAGLFKKATEYYLDGKRVIMDNEYGDRKMDKMMKEYRELDSAQKEAEQAFKEALEKIEQRVINTRTEYADLARQLEDYLQKNAFDDKVADKVARTQEKLHEMASKTGFKEKWDDFDKFKEAAQDMGFEEMFKDEFDPDEYVR